MLVRDRACRLQIVAAAGRKRKAEIPWCWFQAGTGKQLTVADGGCVSRPLCLDRFETARTYLGEELRERWAKRWVDPAVRGGAPLDRIERKPDAHAGGVDERWPRRPDPPR